MAVNPSKPGPMTNVYEFGPFRLDPTEGLLLRNGTPVPLMPKTFEVLRVLVENRGRLLQKDELMKLVWPESFVEEGNLSHHVFTLRKALGDDKGSAYIETVPKRGYRFIAPVREVGRTLGLGAMSAYVDVAERTVTTPDAPPPFQPMHGGATTEPGRWRFTRGDRRGSRSGRIRMDRAERSIRSNTARNIRISDACCPAVQAARCDQSR